ncbi:hypothetical protein AVEN_72472-1 [Araneus ventricosus]|uniref:Uncharacterized protein n=1 Tax=Araneus ventricosus TaxID=182803 RepID=A0A4Y2G3K4_ARAVE|nr:hypothetical protein AVEN_72472-1 [Araneus ventricosus]
MPLKVEKNKITVATIDMAQMRNAALILGSGVLVASTRTILPGFASTVLESYNFTQRTASFSHSSGVSTFQTLVSNGGSAFKTEVSSGDSGFPAGLPWFIQTVEVRTFSRSSPGL